VGYPNEGRAPGHSDHISAFYVRPDANYQYGRSDDYAGMSGGPLLARDDATIFSFGLLSRRQL